MCMDSPLIHIRIKLDTLSVHMIKASQALPVRMLEYNFCLYDCAHVKGAGGGEPGYKANI